MAKSFKRTLIATLGVLFLVVTALAFAACSTKSFKVTLDFESTQGSVVLDPEADGNTYAADTEVKVTVTPNTGYEVDTFLVNGTAATLDANSSYTFKVEKDTTVAVTFKVTTYTITLSNDTNKGTVTLDKSGPLASGTEVKGTIAPKAAYDVDSVKVNDTPVTVANDLTFTFTVNGPTAVNVVYKDAEPGDPLPADYVGTYKSILGDHILTIAADVVRVDGVVKTVEYVETDYYDYYTIALYDDAETKIEVIGDVLYLTPSVASGSHKTEYYLSAEAVGSFSIDAHLNGTHTGNDNKTSDAYTVVVADGGITINGDTAKVVYAAVDETFHTYMYLVVWNDTVVTFSDKGGYISVTSSEFNLFDVTSTPPHSEVVFEMDDRFVGIWSCDYYVLEIVSAEDIKLKSIIYTGSVTANYTVTVTSIESPLELKITYVNSATPSGSPTESSLYLMEDEDGVVYVQLFNATTSSRYKLYPVQGLDGHLDAFPESIVFEGAFVSDDGKYSLRFTEDTLTAVINGTKTTIGIADVTPVLNEDSYILTAIAFTVGDVEYSFALSPERDYSTLEYIYTLSIGDEDSAELTPFYDIPASWYGTYANDDETYSLTVSADGVTAVLNGEAATLTNVSFSAQGELTFYVDDVEFTVGKYNSESDVVYQLYIYSSDDTVDETLTDEKKVPPYSTPIDEIPYNFIGTWYFLDEGGVLHTLTIASNKITITVGDTAPVEIPVANVTLHDGNYPNPDVLCFTFNNANVRVSYSWSSLRWSTEADNFVSYDEYSNEIPVLYGDASELLADLVGTWEGDDYTIEIEYDDVDETYTLTIDGNFADILGIDPAHPTWIAVDYSSDIYYLYFDADGTTLCFGDDSTVHAHLTKDAGGVTLSVDYCSMFETADREHTLLLGAKEAVLDDTQTFTYVAFDEEMYGFPVIEFSGERFMVMHHILYIGLFDSEYELSETGYLWFGAHDFMTDDVTADAELVGTYTGEYDSGYGSPVSYSIEVTADGSFEISVDGAASTTAIILFGDYSDGDALYYLLTVDDAYEFSITGGVCGLSIASCMQDIELTKEGGGDTPAVEIPAGIDGKYTDNPTRTVIVEIGVNKDNVRTLTVTRNGGSPEIATVTKVDTAYEGYNSVITIDFTLDETACQLVLSVGFMGGGVTGTITIGDSDPVAIGALQLTDDETLSNLPSDWEEKWAKTWTGTSKHSSKVYVVTLSLVEGKATMSFTIDGTEQTVSNFRWDNSYDGQFTFNVTYKDADGADKTEECVITLESSGGSYHLLVTDFDANIGPYKVECFSSSDSGDDNEGTIGANGLNSLLYGTWEGTCYAQEGKTYTIEITADKVYLTVDSGEKTEATLSAITNNGKDFTLTAGSVVLVLTSSDDVSNLTCEDPFVNFSKTA